MTNILTVAMIVILQTNITEQFVQTGTTPIPCLEGRAGCLVYHCEPTYSATEKWEIKTVNEVTKAVFKDGTECIVGTKPIDRQRWFGFLFFVLFGWLFCCVLFGLGVW